jgi:hypothetical protein
MISLGVACALATPSFVLAQEKKAAPAAAAEEVAVKKALEAMKREAAVKVKEQEVRLQKIRVMPAPPAAPIVVNNIKMINVNVNVALVAQFTQQFRGILRAEYELLVAVCAPTKEQRKQIARAGEKGLQGAALKVGEWQQRGRVQRAGQPLTNPDPRKIIQDALVAAVSANLSPEQAARYQEEVAERMANQRLVALHNLVEKFDHYLVLTADQRDKLFESLSTHWDDSWCQSLQVFINEDIYFPPVPEKHIAPILTPAQKKVWDGTQKAQRILYGGMVNGVGMEANTPLEDAELGAAQ